MRRRHADPLAAVPADLRDFHLDTWLALTVPEPEPVDWPVPLRHELAAVEEWVAARRRWSDAHGFPPSEVCEADGLAWIRGTYDTRRRVWRGVLDGAPADEEAPITVPPSASHGRRASRRHV